MLLEFWKGLGEHSRAFAFCVAVKTMFTFCAVVKTGRPTGASERYTKRSGEIQEILGEMLQTFKDNLAEVNRRRF